MSKNRIGMTLIVLLMITGCGDQRILEQTGFIHSTGFDFVDDDLIKYSLEVPKLDPDISTSREFLETTGKSSKEARIELARKSNLILTSGQLRNALFGSALARKGILEYMDTLKRDPTVTENVHIVVVNGDAGSLLQKKYKEYPRTGKYVDRLIEKESKGQTVPKTTIYSFVRDCFDDGIDPIAPVIKDMEESIVIEGIGLFRDDKYVGLVPANDSIIFAFLKRKFRRGELYIDLSEETQESNTVMLSSMVSSRNIRVKRGENGTTNVVIHTKATVSILEYSGQLNLAEDRDRQKLEREISEMMTKRAMKLVKQLQEKKVDPLGIGMYIRNSMAYKDWKQINWRDEYPSINIQPTVDIQIKDFGFIDSLRHNERPGRK